MGRFGRVLTAMITPFTADGSLDLDGARELAQWLVANGNDGLVIAGTTGESATLSHEEQGQLIEAVVDAVDVPVVAGAGSNSTAEAMSLARHAATVGAEALLVVAPYYNRPSQEGLFEHYRAVAGAAELPVVLYDVPVRTGRKVSTETILRLTQACPNVVGLKDAAGNPAETAHLIAQAPSSFEVYSGDDALTMPLLAVGAVGVVGVATHWSGVEHQQMFDAWDAGDVSTARKINQMLLPSFRYETGDDAPNPIPTKAMMRVLGLPGGPTRPPMTGEPPSLESAARDVAAGLAVASRLG